MNFWEIGYTVFACITWFLLFGLMIKMKRPTDTTLELVVALVVLAMPLSLVWPLTLTLSTMANIGKGGAKS